MSFVLVRFFPLLVKYSRKASKQSGGGYSGAGVAKLDEGWTTTGFPWALLLCNLYLMKEMKLCEYEHEMMEQNTGEDSAATGSAASALAS